MPPVEEGWRARRVLIGFDGSEGSRDAVALASSLAEVGADFLLVDVIPPVGIVAMRPRRLEDEEPPQSEGFFIEGLEALAGRPVETRTYVANSTAHVLSEITEEEHFDLIVIGSCYPGTIGRMLVGSVGNGLMHGAAAPVAVAPRGYADHHHRSIERVAVAYDSSPEAQRALAHAATLARRESASLRLLYVAPPPPSLAVRAEEVDAPRPSAEAILADGLAAAGPGLEVEQVRLQGRKAAAVIAAACEEDVDLLVVGSRGCGALGRVAIGSVATGLLHRARCPVLVVPRAQVAPVGVGSRPPQEQRPGTDGTRHFAAKDGVA